MVNDNSVKIGLGIVILRDGKILLGERIAGHGAGNFQIPGGHLEFGESLEDGAKREAKEETGLDVEIKKIISVSNDIAYDKHYVTIGFLAESFTGKPQNAEPEKSQNWQWYETNNLPSPIFHHSKRVIENWLNGQIYPNTNSF